MAVSLVLVHTLLMGTSPYEYSYLLGHRGNTSMTDLKIDKAWSAFVASQKRQAGGRASDFCQSLGSFQCSDVVSDPMEHHTYLMLFLGEESGRVCVAGTSLIDSYLST